MKKPSEVRTAPMLHDTIKIDYLATLVSKIAHADEHAAYINALKNYPEDLVCAAYVHLNNRHGSSLSLPGMIAFIEPQLRYRKLFSAR